MEFTSARELDRKSGVRFGERGAPVRFPPAANVYPGFTGDMRKMFNGAPVVTHELAQFVEELDRGDFFG